MLFKKGSVLVNVYTTLFLCQFFEETQFDDFRPFEKVTVCLQK